MGDCADAPCWSRSCGTERGRGWLAQQHYALRCWRVQERACRGKESTPAQMERVTRIELAYQAWEAGVLPLNYTRIAMFIFMVQSIDAQPCCTSAIIIAQLRACAKGNWWCHPPCWLGQMVRAGMKKTPAGQQAFLSGTSSACEVLSRAKR